jgi:hypothetical protein
MTILVCGLCNYGLVSGNLQSIIKDNLTWSYGSQNLWNKQKIPLADGKQMVEHNIYNRFISHGVHRT